MTTSGEREGRVPRRFDLGTQYLRLATAGASESGDAEAWRAKAELILNAAGEGIYGLDAEGRCTFVNPAAARMTGHEVAELLGQRMHDMVHHSHPDGSAYSRSACPIYAAFKDGLLRNVFEEVFWRKDGSCFAVEYTSTPIFNGSVLVGAVVVFRDITLRRKTEDRLRGALLEVQRLKEQLQRENRTLRQEIQSARGVREIVGKSAAIRETLRLVHRIAPTESTVLVTGETGTGKELVARSIHRLSRRASGPLVRLNCGAISPQLADSELFGHERGAFTGAVSQRSGRFEQAHGGTLFLDEVGELPVETQTKLLRVLQEREFERLGGSETLQADVRLIAATNRDLRASVRAGKFREDLFFRLNVVPVHVPALRDRKDDIPLLVDAFLRQLEGRWGRPLGGVTESSLERLCGYHWPGNIRELENTVERAAILSDGEHIEVPEELLCFLVDAEAASEPEAAPESAEEAPASAAAPPTEVSPGSLRQVEREHILRALDRTRWRLAGPGGAGALLGIHPNTLRHRMKKLDIQR
jgi:PAS domain S-box-containing protein